MTRTLRLPRPMDSRSERALESDLEELLWNKMSTAQIPEPVRQLMFWPGRLYRFDFAWHERHLAVECEGGTYSGGHYTTGPGYESDCRKYSEAALRGWMVLRFTRAMVVSGEAMQMIRRALCNLDDEVKVSDES